jgi:hypothetical protein
MPAARDALAIRAREGLLCLFAARRPAGAFDRQREIRPGPTLIEDPSSIRTIKVDLTMKRSPAEIAGIIADPKWTIGRKSDTNRGGCADAGQANTPDALPNSSMQPTRDNPYVPSALLF